MLTKAARGAIGVLLLLCSNCFMNTAWYMHLKFPAWNYAQAIFISWSIALPEYSLQVPANRIAHYSNGGPFTSPQLKVIAEICSLTTFAVFSTIVLKERLRWVDLGAFALILSGVLLSTLTKSTPLEISSNNKNASMPLQPPPSPAIIETTAKPPSASDSAQQPDTTQGTVLGRKMLIQLATCNDTDSSSSSSSGSGKLSSCPSEKLHDNHQQTSQ